MAQLSHLKPGVLTPPRRLALLLVLSFSAACVVSTSDKADSTTDSPVVEDTGQPSSDSPADTGEKDTGDSGSGEETGTPWYRDGDSDGWGDDSVMERAVTAPSGYVAIGGDCDDTNPEIHPEAQETCDGVDEDCDGEVDEDAMDMQTWYVDGDDDGYGTSETVAACTQPDGAVSISGDCDDDDETINPGAEEICNDWIDQDCDGLGLGCGLAGRFDLSDADTIYYSVIAGHNLGYSADDVGDVDGDGLADILLGSHDVVHDDPGRVFVFFGGRSGALEADEADVVMGDLMAISEGGTSVAGVGDVDADGYVDILIGAPGSDNQCGAAFYAAGEALLVDGPYGAQVSLDQDPVRLIGAYYMGSAGHTVAAAGDVDGDGYDDILVSNPSYEDMIGDFGRITLVHGPVDSTTHLEDIDSRCMASSDSGVVALTGGDINGDGYADVLEGNPDSVTTSHGKVNYWEGPIEDSISFDAYSRFGEGLYTGSSVAIVGDTNGDGINDVAIGDELGYDGQGMGLTYLFSADALTMEFAEGDALATIWGEADGDQAGHSVSGAGDVNGDGYADLLVGAPGVDFLAVDNGAAYLLRGPVTGEVNLVDADAVFMGDDDADAAGSVVRGVGDTNGDGYDDILITAPDADLGEHNGGAAYLFLGGGM